VVYRNTPTQLQHHNINNVYCSIGTYKLNCSQIIIVLIFVTIIGNVRSVLTPLSVLRIQFGAPWQYIVTIIGIVRLSGASQCLMDTVCVTIIMIVSSVSSFNIDNNYILYIIAY